MRNNYQPLTSQISISDIEQEINVTPQIEDLPKCFNLNYYLQHQEQCDEKSTNWYRWGSLRIYAHLVKNLYIKLIKQLNSTTCQPVILPKYIESAKVDAPIDLLIKQLEEQEASLFQSFNKDPSKVEKKFEKHQTLKELREYGAMCWLMWQNQTRDNFYHSIVDFQIRNQDKDLAIDRNTALLYVGHVKTKNFIKTKVSNYFSTNRTVNPFKEKHPISNVIYANIKTEPLFEKLMSTLNGYKYLEREEWFKDRLQEITDEKAGKVINFYKNYPDVKYVYKNLLNIKETLSEHCYEHETIAIYFDAYQDKRDFFNVAENYLEQIEELLVLSSQFEEYSFINKDCMFLKSKLMQALNENKEFHDEMLNRKEMAIIKFREKFGTFPHEKNSSNEYNN
ncbi:MAG: hypothetical protein J6Q13_02350 [Clostridia bacterium]|nr:hypothetical protein [Clostridia bacterium]